MESQTIVDRQQWYLGNMTGDSATNILKASGEPNTFVVYMDQDRGIYMLAMRSASGTSDSVIHLEIQCIDGKYKVKGQMEQFTDVVEAVNRFTAVYNPRLSSAFDSQLTSSVAVAPPSYSQAQRTLQPEVAPLPKLTELQREGTPLDPSGSNAYNNVSQQASYIPDTRDHHNSVNHLLHCIITCFCPCYAIVWIVLCCCYE